MIGQLIRFVPKNLPAVLFVAAMILASLRRRGSAAERFPAWLLLPPIGFSGLWDPAGGYPSARGTQGMRPISMPSSARLSASSSVASP